MAYVRQEYLWQCSNDIIKCMYLLTTGLKLSKSMGIPGTPPFEGGRWGLKMLIVFQFCVKHIFCVNYYIVLSSLTVQECG
jgi:hypothetical protein